MAAKKTVTVADMADMSVPERIHLVEDIWDSIAAEAESVPISPEQMAEIDRRIRSMRKNPGAGIPWEVAKARIRSRR